MKPFHLFRVINSKQAACSIALLLMCAISFAQAVDCRKAMTTQDINYCATQEQKKVEVKLNQAYQRALKLLDQPDTELERYSETKKMLITAQRAWVKFREADCAAVYQLHAGGTIRGVMYIGCMQSRAEQRIKELNEFSEQ